MQLERTLPFILDANGKRALEAPSRIGNFLHNLAPDNSVLRRVPHLKLYSSGSSAATGSSASSAARFASKAFEMYLRKIQAEGDMFVVGWFKVLTELVGSEEQLRLETEVAAVAIGLLSFGGLRARRIAG